MKTILKMLLLAWSFSLCAMSEPYNSIKDLPFDAGDWLFINAKYIKEVLNSKKVMTAIEVGSWLGASTRFTASNLPEGAKLYAVDTWQGTTGEDWMQKDTRRPYYYQLFLSNVKHAHLTEVIVPVRMESGEAAKALNIKADYIYVDANHEEAYVYRDIMLWYPHLAPGGVMCGDDWRAASVKRGVERAAKELGVKIYAEQNFWKFI